MKNGFIKAAAATPVLRVADSSHNADAIAMLIHAAAAQHTELIVFPELCLTGYTCGDLFLQKALLDSSLMQLIRIAQLTAEDNIVSVVGLPVEYKGKLYNCGAVICRGSILGIVPKTNLPSHADLSEQRHFSSLGSSSKPGLSIEMDGKLVPFGTKLLFPRQGNKDFVLGVEIGADLWSPISPSSYHALNGATIIANLSADNETAGKAEYRRSLIANQSGRLLCGYIYAGAGAGESTTDMVFAAHNIICENGSILAESNRYANETVYAELDVSCLTAERRRNTSFITQDDGYYFSPFELQDEHTSPTRKYRQMPFVPDDDEERNRRCEDILTMQALGLKTRIERVGLTDVVIGISGGLDSTLAILATIRAFDWLKLDRMGIHTVTVPCFGTSERTYQNAVRLAALLGTSFSEINITESVQKHFEDIGHDPGVHDLTYENAQARERTQVLMDIASKVNGFVVGTGDLSELALGFATYNGDHMSMYGVNASIPKTLIKYLIQYCADQSSDKELKQVLRDILDTPVSPELLPPENGSIIQVTEDIVGPYILHDFFLYHMIRFGHPPDKIYRLACMSFDGLFEEAVILKWLKSFYKRFFTQQYKRSCMPDGPKVGSVALSPRGDWRMPSDAYADIWLAILDKL